MEDIKNNPWLGLQTYKEGDILYGRDDDIRNLSQYILTDSETVLFGRSGIGKSSVLNAGVIPMARMRGIIPVTIRLAHNPDDEPYTTQIYNKIKDAGVDCGKIKKGATLWELFHCNDFKNENGERVRLLLMFDQFEEIFTLQQNPQKKTDFFKELADQINDVMPHSLSGVITSDNNDEEPEYIKLKEKEEGTEIVLDDMDFSLSEKSTDYSYDNDIHIVLTLREDFLSEFEFYTSSIPSLKQHRYGLRPINEEQAAEIIQKPLPGLVSKDVAKLIIEKVTNRTDFELDGKPEIEVNTAVLSLYLSKFYDKSEGKPFTKELVEKEAGNIINEFYCECIKDVPENIVEGLETALVNKEGHRENKSLRGLSDDLNAGDYIRQLIGKKLLSTFQYAGETKVEFIHDILCDVVLKRKEQKEKRIEEEKERLRLREQNRRSKIRLYGVSCILVIALFAIAYLVFNNNKLKNEKGFGISQEFSIRITEDALVVANNDHWEARLLVIGEKGNNKDTVLIDSVISKSKNMAFKFKVDSVKSFGISLDFTKRGNMKYYQNIEKELTIADFTENKELELNVKFDDSKMITYEGQMVMEVDGKNINLQDIIVVLKNQLAQTDNEGYFRFSFTDSLNQEDVIHVIRDGFSFKEEKALENGQWRKTFIISPSDSLSSFKLKCERMDSVSNWYYKSIGQNSKGVKVKKADGHVDNLFFYALRDGNREDGSFAISGYYYYLSEYEKLEEDKKYLSYYLFTGWMDKYQGTRNEPEKAFKVESYDKVGNKQILTGWRAKKTWQIKGFIVNINDTIAAFGECIK